MGKEDLMLFEFFGIKVTSKMIFRLFFGAFILGMLVGAVIYIIQIKT